MVNRIALVVAVVLACLSILLIKLYVDRIKEQVLEGKQPVRLAVARRDIHAGEELEEAMIEYREYAQTFYDALQSAIPESDVRSVIGQRLTYEVRAGQILQHVHFQTPRGTQARLTIQDGMRAITIPVDRVAGVSGMLRPGDFVDVIAVSEFEAQDRSQSGSKYQVTHVVLTKVRILAIDAITDDRGVSERFLSRYGTVTLEVDPDEANRVIHQLKFAEAVHLARRNPQDVSETAGRPFATIDEFEELLQQIEERSGATGGGRR